MNIKKFLAIYILLSFSYLCYSQVIKSDDSSKNKQIAVFVYNDKTVTTQLNALRSKLTSSLINEDYTVVDRTEEIANLLRDIYSYQAGGLVADDQLISVGNNLSANYICAVNVTYYQDYNQYFFDCKIINVEKRQIEKQAYYPESENSLINDLRPQTQISIAGELAKQLGFKKKLKVGDEYNLIPGYTGFKVGYIDQTGEHGLAYKILNISNRPYVGDAKTGVRAPTDKELLNNISGIRATKEKYWALSSSGEFFWFDSSTGTFTWRDEPDKPTPLRALQVAVYKF